MHLGCCGMGLGRSVIIYNSNKGEQKRLLHWASPKHPLSHVRVYISMFSPRRRWRVQAEASLSFNTWVSPRVRSTQLTLALRKKGMVASSSHECKEPLRVCHGHEGVVDVDKRGSWVRPQVSFTDRPHVAVGRGHGKGTMRADTGWGQLYDANRKK